MWGLTDGELTGLIFEKGGLLDSEEGRPPTQLERFHWIIQAQLRKVYEELSKYGPIQDHSIVKDVFVLPSEVWAEFKREAGL